MQFPTPRNSAGHLVNYLNGQVAMRQKCPFGMHKLAKPFAMIFARQFYLPCREFEQMECSFRRSDWARNGQLMAANSVGIGICTLFYAEKILWHEHGPTELAHYESAGTILISTFLSAERCSEACTIAETSTHSSSRIFGQKHLRNVSPTPEGEVEKYRLSSRHPGGLIDDFYCFGRFLLR
jgi:glycyl-tRNA synthetase (class II)